MIKKIIIIILVKIFTPLVIIRYKNIWNLKSQLENQDKPNELLLAIYNAYFGKQGSWICYKAEFKGVPFFPHQYFGIFISSGAKIGKNAVIFQHVTIGSNHLNDNDIPGSPCIGDNVFIGAGSKIIGNVQIGNNCRIGANAVVYKSLPPNSVAVQQPTRIIQKGNLDNRWYRKKMGKRVFYDDGKWISESKS